MKAFSKFLILLVLVLGLTFIAWKVLETSLFNEEDDITPSPMSGVVAPAANTQVEPPPIQNQEDLYQSTSSDEPPPPLETQADSLTCQASVTIIGKIYDLKESGKTLDEANEFISNDDSVPDAQVSSFIEFANTLWNSPAEKIVPKAAFLKNFLQQCQSLEKEQKAAPAAQ